MPAAPGGIPAAPRDSARRLADVILAESRRAELRPGSRLPAERQLAARLKATRSAVRQALDVLEADGVVWREAGRGAFLRDPGAAGTGRFAPADLVRIRQLLEPLAVRLAVAWATAADFQEMDRCLERAQEAAGDGGSRAWDPPVLPAIVAAAHSPLLTHLYGIVAEEWRGSLSGELKRRGACRERAQCQADCRELVGALRARNAGRAAELIRAHLTRVSGCLPGEFT